MFTVKLEQNREDRPRYVTLVRYEERWLPVGDGTEVMTVIPVRRTMTWVVDPDGKEEAFVCVRATELPFKAIKAQPAHRELIAQWKGHLSKLVEGARPVAVEVLP